MADPDPAGVARAERDHVIKLAAAHQREHEAPLRQHGCPCCCAACRSLAAHLDRTERQLALLVPAAEPDAPVFPGMSAAGDHP